MNQNTHKITWTALAISLLLVTGCDKNSSPIAASRPVASDSTVQQDVAMSIQLKERLAKHPLLKDLQISVVTAQGNVRLIATLDNQAQIDVAIAVAKSMDGVTSVTNDLALADTQVGKY
jgi:osmotically-inducible protein OsmY